MENSLRVADLLLKIALKFAWVYTEIAIRMYGGGCTCVDMDF